MNDDRVTDTHMGEAEQEGGHQVMAARRWTLNQAIAWIATRNPLAVDRDAGAIGLSVWMALSRAEGRSIDFPFSTYEDAWKQLASALADGTLEGMGTHVRAARLGGRSHSALGVRFPPLDQLGLALACTLFDDSRRKGQHVIAPKQRAFATEWDEFSEMTFGREQIIAAFPSRTVDLKALKTPMPRTSASGRAPAKRGPKPKYDRRQFIEQVTEKLEDEGGLAPANGSSFRQSHLEEHMRTWCSQNWEDVPSESTIRDYVVAGIGEYEAKYSGQ